jgi:hypothetical protein
MLDDSILKISPNGSFKVSQLCGSVAICEAMKGDRHNWGNATDTEPAFVVYLGCDRDDVERYLKTLKTFYRCYLNEVRSPKYLKGFEVEIKIHAMQRRSDTHAFGLDYLVDSQQWRDFGCDYDEYDYYATGCQQHW